MLNIEDLSSLRSLMFWLFFKVRPTHVGLLFPSTPVNIMCTAILGDLLDDLTLDRADLLSVSKRLRRWGPSVCLSSVHRKRLICFFTCCPCSAIREAVMGVATGDRFQSFHLSHSAHLGPVCWGYLASCSHSQALSHCCRTLQARHSFFGLLEPNCCSHVPFMHTQHHWFSIC